MPAAHIIFDHSKQLPREAMQALRDLRSARDRLRNARNALVQSIDGAVNVAANFDLLASQGGFQAGDYADANTAAMNFFAEVDSLFGKVCTDAATSEVNAAIDQAPAKLGV